MPKDPIGLLARMNAASLMLVTPESFKVRAARTSQASKIRNDPANFQIRPEYMTLNGVKIRYAKGGQF